MEVFSDGEELLNSLVPDVYHDVDITKNLNRRNSDVTRRNSDVTQRKSDVTRRKSDVTNELYKLETRSPVLSDYEFSERSSACSDIRESFISEDIVRDDDNNSPYHGVRVKHHQSEDGHPNDVHYSEHVVLFDDQRLSLSSDNNCSEQSYIEEIRLGASNNDNLNDYVIDDVIIEDDLSEVQELNNFNDIVDQNDLNNPRQYTPPSPFKDNSREPFSPSSQPRSSFSSNPHSASPPLISSPDQRPQSTPSEDLEILYDTVTTHQNPLSDPTERESDSRSSQLSYLARALALARPTSPPPPYRPGSITAMPTVLTLRSYFGFSPVNSRPHSAPQHAPYSPADMTNEPYTLKATSVLITNGRPYTTGLPVGGDLGITTLECRGPFPCGATTSGATHESCCCPHQCPNRLSNSFGSPSPFTRRRNEDPSFGLHLLGLHRFTTASSPVCSEVLSDHPSQHSQQHQHGRACQRSGFCQRLLQHQGYSRVESCDTTPIPPQDTHQPSEGILSDILNPPPPYSIGHYEHHRAPRYSEVFRPTVRSAMFGRHSSLSCMGAVRTLTIGITLSCCGAVFLLVTYVFGAVDNVYLGYLGILQVFIGLTLILIVAIYNSGRFDFLNFVKRSRVFPCYSYTEVPSSSLARSLC